MTRTARRAPSPTAAGRGLRSARIAALALAAGLAFTGCAAGQVSQTADQVAAIDGANGTVGQIGVRDVLFPETEPGGYATGANVPLLLRVSNEGLAADTLTSVTSTVATSVTIGGTATVPAQTLTTIDEQSPITLTLEGLTAAIPYGFSVPVTFTFEKAGNVTVNVPIAIPAERTGPRETMEILPPHPTPLWETGAHGEEEGH
ncbi:copper chaperone PCu(A)C [Nakamurella alba]|uniref:copper chaperone PCu(A)C n=1 Tax=Nakamurella alba TaxID=2665158 RepID=UPI0018AA4D61|nr:copper chaperone PCu(A)C [Nakamurella alba]